VDRPSVPKPDPDRPPGRTLQARGVGHFFLVTGLLLSCPNQGSAQACLGLSPEPNSMGIEAGVEYQNQGQRIGGWAHANVAGRIGVLAGASGGEMDGFGENGSEVRAVLALVLSPTSSELCLFGEYEGGSESFRDAFGMTWGDYSERWIRFGLAKAGNLWSGAGIHLTWHAAPELVFRRTHLEGRTTYWEPEVYVLETKKVGSSSHLGGRALVAARMRGVQLTLSVKNRPRFSSDLHWAIHLGFPI